MYRKFISAAFQYQANTLIVGGDVTGKAMVPVVHLGGGRYEGYLFGERSEVGRGEELEKFKKAINNVGFYPIVLEKDEAAAMDNDHALMMGRFEREMVQRIWEWMELAEEKLAPAGKTLYFMPGNDDHYTIDAVIDEYPHVHNPDMRRFEIEDGYELYGNSNANMTPWACERDVEEPELAQKLDALAAMVRDPGRAICALHVPPYQSGSGYLSRAG